MSAPPPSARAELVRALARQLVAEALEARAEPRVVEFRRIET